MKKIIIVFAFVAGLVMAQQKIGTAVSVIEETTGDTTYIGMAKTTSYSESAPSTNDAVWRIIRIVTTSTGNSVTQNAYGSGTGEAALWSTAWTNRVNATYK